MILNREDASMKIDVINWERQKVAELEVADYLLQDVERPHLVYEGVRNFLAGQRKGTAATKERSFVSGGGRKPWRQKGTGRARVGSIRAPLWRGGGTIFGPRPRDYSYHLPKKVRQAALRTIIAHKFKESKLLVIDSWPIAEAKTKKFLSILKSLGVKNALIVTLGKDEKLQKSANNIPGVQVIELSGLNVHDILRHEHLIFSPASLQEVERRLHP